MNLGYEPDDLKIYLFGESVDMRKQMNGLIALVEGSVPVHEQKDKIKALAKMI